MHQVLIKNGMIFDPATGLRQIADLAVQDGRITGIGDYDGEAARQVIDAEGCLVTPGLIDHHAHLYPMAAIGIPAEAVCFASGVTTIVDAGSTGCETFAAYLPFLEKSKLRIRAYVNVCSTGLSSLPKRMEDVDPAHFDFKGLEKLFAQYGKYLLGLKLRTSREVVGEMGYRPLKESVRLGEELGVPLMVHCTNPPGTIPELLDCLRPGDVMTHMYMNKGPKLINEDRKVWPEAYEARQRGVYFEAADAREHFSFEVSEPAVAEGFYPDFIATDLTMFSMHLRPTAFDLANQLSKYAQIGIPPENVFAAVTVNPARAMGLADEIGTLKAGACADIAIFKKIESRHPFGDRTYENPDCTLRPCHWRLRTMTTIRAGEIVYRDPEI